MREHDPSSRRRGRPRPTELAQNREHLPSDVLVDFRGDGLGPARESRRIARDPREGSDLERKPEVHHFDRIPAGSREVQHLAPRQELDRLP